MRRVTLAALALLLAPASQAWGQYRTEYHPSSCVECGVPAPSCGCEGVTHCSDCGPRCGCCCLFPRILCGIDRALTNLFTCCHRRHCCPPNCCRPCCRPICGPPLCCDTGPGCCDGGEAWDPGYEEYPGYEELPESDMMNNPFQDDPLPPQARNSRRSRLPRRFGTTRYTRGRVTAVPVRSPAARGRVASVASVTRSAQPAAPRPAAPRTAKVYQDRGAQLASAQSAFRDEAADQPPRMIKVEYAKPIPVKFQPAQGSARLELRSVSSSTQLSGAVIHNETGSQVPDNPLR